MADLLALSTRIIDSFGTRTSAAQTCMKAVRAAYNYGIDYLEPPVELPDQEVRAAGDATPTSLKVSNWRILIGFAIDPQ